MKETDTNNKEPMLSTPKLCNISCGVKFPAKEVNVALIPIYKASFRVKTRGEL